MVRRALSIAVLLITGLGTALAQDRNPAAVVAEIYGSAGPSGHFQKPLAIFADAALRPHYLSSRLQAELADMDKRTPAGDVPNLDFDVVSDSQDPDVQDLKIAAESESASEAVVVADFKSHKETERSSLRYELVREDGAWKIDDVEASGKRHWRVSEIIAGE